MTNLDQLIDNLSEQATPVRLHQAWTGKVMLAALVTASVLALALIFGLREDVLQLRAPVPLLLALGLFGLLVCAAGLQSIRLARPQVGAPPSAAGWLVAALALFPLIAIAAILTGSAPLAGMAPSGGVRCLGIGVLTGALSLGAITIWLRRGAVVTPIKAGWTAGLASGAIGALAVSLECPRDAFAHLGIWHVAVVAVLAIVGRLLVPPLIRW